MKEDKVERNMSWRDLFYELARFFMIIWLFVVFTLSIAEVKDMILAVRTCSLF